MVSKLYDLFIMNIRHSIMDTSYLTIICTVNDNNTTDTRTERSSEIEIRNIELRADVAKLLNAQKCMLIV